MSSIDRESEDIFAGEEYTDDEEESRGDDEEGDDVSCELTAAVALTSLVSSESRDTREDNEGKEASESRSSKGDQEMEELHIPQRFTKSGRKRAVSFPLKVRLRVVGYHHAACLARLNCVFIHILLALLSLSRQRSS
jgi:hypothetical protein